ncbi:MAG: InlB B-repeat-containing protein [Bacilli bacterium]|nr:InlB B-repeat-containing protein [Bacilli bacterium]
MKKLGLLVIPLMAVSLLTNCSSGSKTYVVLFVSNGGTSVPQQEVKANSHLVKPDDPTKNGYTFIKWCTDEALTIEYNFSSVVTNNFVLYAKWSDAIPYQITYNMPEGAEQTNPTSYTVESEDIVLENATIVKEGYKQECDGWHKDSPAGEIITVIPKGSTGDLKLYTSKVASTYSIEYNMPDGATQTNPTSYTVESEDIVLKNATIVKEGYEQECDGWHIGSSTGEKITTIPKGSTGDLKLYTSKVTILYNITYNNLEESTTDNPTSYTVESETITLEKPTERGYEFTGWHKDSPTGELITQIEEGTTGDINLYASWSDTPTTYTITYKNVTAEETAGFATTYTINDLPLTLSTPTRTADWTFNGYYTDETFVEESRLADNTIPTGTAGNLTLYAKMTYNKTLEQCKWPEIKMISEKGGARATFGDPGAQTKNIGVYGNEHQVRIVAYDYDELSTSTKENPQYAGITFEFVNTISSFSTTWNNIDGSDSTNYNFIDKSDLNNCLQPAGNIYKMMPSDLMSVVKTVNKKVEIHPNDEWIEGNYNTQLFPLSYDEIDGNDDKTYEYYKVDSKSRRIKNVRYWLRSPNVDGDASAWYVGENSGVIGSGIVYDTKYTMYAVAPAFCI